MIVSTLAFNGFLTGQRGPDGYPRLVIVMIYAASFALHAWQVKRSESEQDLELARCGAVCRPRKVRKVASRIQTNQRAGGQCESTHRGGNKGDEALEGETRGSHRLSGEETRTCGQDGGGRGVE
jgi:hypothetical protein